MFLRLAFSVFFGKTLLDCFALLLVTRFVEQREHVFLVCFHTRLVERIHAENIPAYAACLFEEVEQCADIVFVYLRNIYSDVGYV